MSEQTFTSSNSSHSKLKSLSRDRTAAPAQSWKPILLVGLMLLGLLAVIWGVFGDRLRPAMDVEVARVVLRPQDTSQFVAATSSSTPAPSPTRMLFQSSGWIEADPWLVRVPVLVDGFVREVLVKEGESVTNAQIVARLVDDDARLAYESLQLKVERLKAEVEAQLTGIRADEAALVGMAAQEEAAAARLAESQERWHRMRQFSQGEVARIDQIAAEQAVLEAQAEQRAAVAGKQHAALKVEQQRGQQAVHKQAVREAEKQVEMAALRLDRMVIRAPQAGVVQQLLVQPGAKRMAGMDDPDSATIVTLFDPKNLQVRVDVPLAEAGKLFVGQRARISTAMLPNQEFVGEVTRIVGEADLQRNTVQVKVAVTAPDPRLRPEVLCRVEFFAGGEGREAVSHASGARELNPGDGFTLWMPEDVAPPGSDPGFVWVVDPFDQTVRQQAVKLGPERRAGYRRVLDGLQANQLVVLRPPPALHDGARVQISMHETGDR